MWGWPVDRRIRALLRHSQFHPTHRYGRGPVLSTGRVQPATLRYHPANDGQRESWWKQLTRHHAKQHRPNRHEHKQPSRFRSDCLSKSKCHGQQYRLAAAGLPPQCTHQQRNLVANILAHARTRNRVNEAQPCAYVSRVEQVEASAQKRNSEDSDPKRDLPTHSWPFRG